MYEPHPEFPEPENPNAKIWRFMDVGKLLSVLYTSSLYFARGDKFEDPYEGMLTDFIAENIKASDASKQAFNMWHQLQLNTRYDTYINCWQLNEHESAGMWKLYSAQGAGVAIQSTFRSFVDSIAKVEEPVHVGIVKYGDEHLRGDTMPNGFAFWMSKRKSFEHEQELRALIWRPRNIGVGNMLFKGGKWEVAGYPVADSNTPVGIKLEVNLETLVQRVMLSPETPGWMLEITKDLIKRYGYSFEVEQSKLYQQPFQNS